jgi:hypothetical protein
MVPFRPRSSLSLKVLGSYMPSSSRIRVSVKAQISSSLVHSTELRARRDTSIPITIPALPRAVLTTIGVGSSSLLSTAETR